MGPVDEAPTPLVWEWPAEPASKWRNEYGGRAESTQGLAFEAEAIHIVLIAPRGS
jgi:hypothetical protein